MIIIKDSDFEMVQHKQSTFFDLTMPVTINEGTEKERSEMKVVGYGMTFEACLKKIISQRLTGTYTISEYITAYSEEVFKISKLVQKVANE